jgi:hypothetical protein
MKIVDIRTRLKSEAPLWAISLVKRARKLRPDKALEIYVEDALKLEWENVVFIENGKKQINTENLRRYISLASRQLGFWDKTVPNGLSRSGIHVKSVGGHLVLWYAPLCREGTGSVTIACELSKTQKPRWISRKRAQGEP